jgi:hypothetical protein
MDRKGALAYTLKGSLGSDVNVILKLTLGFDLAHIPCARARRSASHAFIEPGQKGRLPCASALWACTTQLWPSTQPSVAVPPKEALGFWRTWTGRVPGGQVCCVGDVRDCACPPLSCNPPEHDAGPSFGRDLHPFRYRTGLRTARDPTRRVSMRHL